MGHLSSVSFFLPNLKQSLKNNKFLGGDDATLPTKNTNGSAGPSKQPETTTDDAPSPPNKKERDEEDETTARPTVVLHSHKMKELKDLLLAEKLNTQAISLHLTAQSQVQIGKKCRGEPETYGVRPKRKRRE